MNESINDTNEISQMICQEIANEVRTKFNVDFSTKVKWSELNLDSKVDMAEFAESLLINKGYKTNQLVKVLQELNIDACEGNRPNTLNTSLAKSLRKRKNGILPRKKRVRKQIVKSNDFLSNLLNSDDDKMSWIKSSLTGPKDPKHRRRGGKFAGTDRRGINKFMLFQRCYNNCPYCQSELDYGANPMSRGFDSRDKTHTKHRASLDRIDPEVGYSDTNIQVICMHCNTLKGNATVDEILQLARAMEKQYKILKASGHA
jgi:hypothetical protein